MVRFIRKKGIALFMLLSIGIITNIVIAQAEKKEVQANIVINEKTIKVNWTIENELSKYEGLIVQCVKYDSTLISLTGLSHKSVKYTSLSYAANEGTFEMDVESTGMYLIRIISVSTNGIFETLKLKNVEIQ